MTTHADETSREASWDWHFRTDYLKEDLRGRSVRGGAATLVAEGVGFVLSVGATVVLGRLLTPADFGVVGMVLALVGYATLFRTMGLPAFTIQRADITHAQVSTLFWMNLVLSLAVVFGILALAPAIAWFFGDPRLTWIAFALAISSLFVGLTAQHAALLSRQMRLKAKATISIVSMSLGIVAAILAALLGAGYWALVVQRIVEPLVETIGVWTACRWRPGLPRRHCGIRSMLWFGGNLTASSFVGHSSRNLDNVLIGWSWGAQALGIYTKAYALLLLPIRHLATPIELVAVPALCRLQNEPHRYRSYYMNVTGLMMLVAMPAVTFVWVAADDLVPLVLGSQWDDMVPVFRALTPAAFLGALLGTFRWLYISRGRADRLLQWGLISATVNISAFVIGLPWGPVGVATAYSLSMILLTYPAITFCFAGSSLRLLDLVTVLWTPAFACVWASIGAFLALQWVDGFQWPVYRLFASFTVFSIVYASSLLALPSGRARLLQLRRLSRDLNLSFFSNRSKKVQSTVT